jgi:uncharacterized protein YjbI with pentapeptide repeats
MPNLTQKFWDDFTALTWPRITAWSWQRWLWLKRNLRIVLWMAVIAVAVVLLVGLAFESGAIWPRILESWRWYRGKKSPNEALGPILTLVTGLAVAIVALMRHFAQTKADRLRRIIESFSKAIEQLGSDKLEVRLGGIYALERISQESPQDYWTVVENLTAFVRERTRSEAELLAKSLEQRLKVIAHSLWEKDGKPEGRSDEFWSEAKQREARIEPLATDVAAVLTVINRRKKADRNRESRDERVLDFQQAVLRLVNFHEAPLKRANFSEAHLEGANFARAQLEGADFRGAHLEGANFGGAHLEGANFSGARTSEHTYFGGAQLRGAYFSGAHLEGITFHDAQLRGAKFDNAQLGGTRFHRAQLVGATFMLAHLEGATFNRAQLRGAFFFKAQLEGTDFAEAEIKDTTFRETGGLTQPQIDVAFGDADTVLPEKLSQPEHWAKPMGGGAGASRVGRPANSQGA